MSNTTFLRLTLPLAMVFLLGTIAHAASEAEIQLVYDAVRSKFPNFEAYCKLPDEERRKTVVQATLALAGAKKLADPMGAGPLAGNQLRRDCGLADANAADMSRLRWTVNAKPLAFETGQHAIGPLTNAASLANRIYTPEGAGPFPAVVLNHTIGGVSPHLLVQAKALLAAGYAVLLVDSYGPRGVRPGEVLFPAEVAKDAYDARAHLANQIYIDKDRIFQSGYSLGAMAAALLASPQGAENLKATGRFRASVAHYGTCATQESATATKMEMLSADSDRPILMLMGELDIETPPKTCFPLLEQMKAAGKDVHWHIYPHTTHGWDKAEHNGLVYRTNSGETMTYRYDAAVAKDASERMIAFFNRYR